MKLILAVAFLVPPLASAQIPLPACASPTAAAFDVASVKPSEINSHSSHNGGSADSITSSGSVLSMIEYAYNLRDFQISGGPDWITTVTWDAVAKVDQPVPDWASLRSDDRAAIQRQRMAAVLAQRFALRCHFETKQLPVYNLVVAKGGPRLAATPADAKKKNSLDWDGEGRQNRMVGAGIDLGAVARNLTWSLGRVVVDKTGLTGLYDFTLTYSSTPDATSSAADDTATGPTIFTALVEQLGLRLEPAKGPVPVLVIDSISRPSDN